ncbi:MAG: TRAP transporter fused permease subunit [Desulfobacterales bacterium]|nr:TRAP transporter fused permease subunit [Desulfobacterales bacterium]
MPAEKKAAGKYRSLRGMSRGVSTVMLAAMPVLCVIYILDFHTYLGLALYKEQYLGVFLALFLAAAFINIPAGRRSAREAVPWYDTLLALASLVVFGNVALFYPDLIVRLGVADTSQVILGVVAVFLVLEGVRRIIGYPLIIIGLVLILYARYASFFPGLLYARGVSWPRVFSFIYLDPNSLLGIPNGVASTMVLGFLLFGACLFMVGGGEFLSNVAMALMGRQRGGAAKVAVIASGLFGSLSGAPSANVAVTGVVTIPLMKRSGYTPNFAAAVEATASTGGLVLPPVMGITAFMMAEFLSLPYYEIALAAAIPAVLYYVALLVQVHLEAVKMGIKGLSPEDLPVLGTVLKKGWIYVIPIFGLLYFLFWMRLNPTASAIYAAVMMVLVGIFRKENRTNFWRKLLYALEDTGKQVLVVGAACSVAGIVIGSVSLTNLGLSLSKTLIALSGGNSLALLALAAIGAIILGMGMPIAATYIMLVILIAPALVQTGIDPLAAHMFINFFGAMSFVTPPVCVACFVAAGIANSAPMKTGYISMRLGIGAYLVPFAFCYSTGLLMMGSMASIALSVAAALLAVLSVSVALSGYLLSPLNWLKIGLFSAAGILLITPRPMLMGIGFAVLLLLAGWEFHERQSKERTGHGRDTHRL